MRRVIARQASALAKVRMAHIHKMTAAFTKDDRRDLAFANVGLQVEALLSRSPRLCGPGGKVCRSLSSPPGIVRRRRT
jgi:hypothetical protein